mmetsp:Transcript_24673/g.59545  ORF Transcript_24673/g.59545 Transcript_24673/m.59545 type:complete len:83 (-) Transcript_24673:344-592(-)
MTYRLCDHTTADDANRYRPQAELKAAEHAEPISRLRRYLTTQEEEARRRGGEEERLRPIKRLRAAANTMTMLSTLRSTVIPP